MLTRRRGVLIALTIVVAVIVLATTIWREELRTLGRDIRYSTTAPIPQGGVDFERFDRMHKRILERKAQGPIDVLFLGDSITEFWESPENKTIWDEHFAPLNAANFGVSSDGTQHVLWRITEGREIDGLSPKVVVLKIGTNNTPTNSAPAIARGVEKIIETLRGKLPNAKILLLSVLPREEGGERVEARVRAVNARLAKLDDGKVVRYLDIAPKFRDSSGKPAPEMLRDGLHLGVTGYQTLADAIHPEIVRMLDVK